MKMNREDRNINGVNETQAPSEAVTPSRVSGKQQPAPDRYPATARTKMDQGRKQTISNPGIRGYRKPLIS